VDRQPFRLSAASTADRDDWIKQILGAVGGRNHGRLVQLAAAAAKADDIEANNTSQDSDMMLGLPYGIECVENNLGAVVVSDNYC